MSDSAAKRLASLAAIRDNLLQQTQFEEEWVPAIKPIEENNEDFVEVDWDYKGIESNALEALANAIKSNTYLTTISLCGNNLDDDQIAILLHAIRKNKTLPLKDLNLSFNQITAESAPTLAKLMLRRGLTIQLFGNDVESLMADTESSLRLTRKPSRTSIDEKKETKKPSRTSADEKKEKRKTPKRKASATSTMPKPSSKNSTVRRTKSKSKDLAPTSESCSISDDLTEKLREMLDEEQEFIMKIEELERRTITLMQNKVQKGGSVKESTGFIGKFKRSLTLEKKNVIITRKLAEIGGSGAGVYSCLVDGWKCAMKELDATYMSKYTIDGFMGEINLLELLPQHDNISRYLFHEISGSRIRLFMTQYHGSLGNVIQKHYEADDPFTPADIWRYCLDMIKGIEFLHSNGIVHRDLKSDNIFILLDERGKILKCAIGDFDTAKQVNSKAEQAKTVLGTPAWMAPEVMDARELGAYSYPCDVYSFGMILYELLTLQMPYTGMNPMRIPMMVLQGQKPPLPELDSSFSKLVKLYEKCSAFKPKDRPTVKSIKSTIALAISG